MIAPSRRGPSAAALKWREPSGRWLCRSVRALGSRVADVEIKVAERGQATARALTHWPHTSTDATFHSRRCACTPAQAHTGGERTSNLSPAGTRRPSGPQSAMPLLAEVASCC